MPTYKHFQVYEIDGVSVIRLNGPRLFETILISELDDELIQYAETHRPQKLLVDFETVVHCSSAVINSLLRVKKRLLGHQGKLRLCAMHPSVRDAYRLLNLDGTVFEIHESRHDALAGF